MALARVIRRRRVAIVHSNTSVVLGGGRLFSPGDAGALARIAAELLDDPLVRGRLGTAAAGDVRARFAPELLIERVGALYDEVLSTG